MIFLRWRIWCSGCRHIQWTSSGITSNAEAWVLSLWVLPLIDGLAQTATIRCCSKSSQGCGWQLQESCWRFARLLHSLLHPGVANSDRRTAQTNRRQLGRKQSLLHPEVQQFPAGFVPAYSLHCCDCLHFPPASANPGHVGSGK